MAQSAELPDGSRKLGADGSDRGSAPVQCNIAAFGEAFEKKRDHRSRAGQPHNAGMGDVAFLTSRPSLLLAPLGSWR